MSKVNLEIRVDGKLSDGTLSEIIRNIVEHVENENKFWQTEGMLDENQEVSVTVIDEALLDIGTDAIEGAMEALRGIQKEGDAYRAYDEPMDVYDALESQGLVDSKRHTSRMMWLGTSYTLTPKGEEVLRRHAKEGHDG